MFREESVYRRLFSNMLNGLAYCRVVYEGDKPVDFIYLMVNEAFYRLVGAQASPASAVIAGAGPTAPPPPGLTTCGSIPAPSITASAWTA